MAKFTAFALYVAALILRPRQTCDGCGGWMPKGPYLLRAGGRFCSETCYLHWLNDTSRWDDDGGAA